MKNTLKNKKTIIFAATICSSVLLLPACVTTSSTPSVETLDYASIKGLDTSKGLGLLQNATMRSYYYANVATIDGQKPPLKWSGPTMVAPGKHTIVIQCMTNSNSFDYTSLILDAKPQAQYQIVLNLPNPTDYYVQPCKYAAFKEIS